VSLGRLHRATIHKGDDRDQEGAMEPFSYTNKHGATYYLHTVRGCAGQMAAPIT